MQLSVSAGRVYNERVVNNCVVPWQNQEELGRVTQWETCKSRRRGR